MFIDDIGNVYLIDNTYKVFDTGLHSTKELYNSLIDGEYISCDKRTDKSNMGLFAAFDMYYYGGNRITSLPLIEDEAKIADFVLTGLSSAGMQAVHLADGSAGLQRALSTPFDAIVLDVMLPSLDGISVLKRLRASGLATPIVLLTAKTDLQDRLQGFEAGADDYLPKPFFIEELVARIKILINRQAGLTASLIEENGLQLNRISREATWSDHQATLSQREFTLIEYLIRSPDHIFSRNQILKHVWGLDFDPKTNVVDVCIQRIRKKLIHPRKGDPKNFPIESIRGIGYRFRKA